MIEATCAACGTQNRIAESDVPGGALFVNCASCKSRVPLPPAKTMMGGGAGLKPPAIPAIKPPPMPAPPKHETIDLADLPAPKRSAPLAGADGGSRPAPRSGLAAADEADLPAPKSRRASQPIAVANAPLDLDDLLAPVGVGVSDLPAPKPRGGFADLPAPKGRPPAPIAESPRDLIDLPAPKATMRGVSDLPAPKGPSSIGITDLPTPKGIPNLPMPKGPGGSIGITDLPTPKGITDLPTPKGISDLPTPKHPGGSISISDLPTPKPGQTAKGAGNDIAPKGFFDDLPQPAHANRPGSTTDVPAPKGFFDDLPGPQSHAQAHRGTDVAPKGFFDDIPAVARDVGPQLPTPKPQQPVRTATPAQQPSGFFDDLNPDTQTPVPKLSLGFDEPKLELETPRQAPSSSGVADLDLELAPPAQEPPSAPNVSFTKTPSPTPSSSGGSFDDLDLSSPSTPSALRQSGSQNAATPAIASQMGSPMSMSAAVARAGGNELELELEPSAQGPQTPTKRPNRATPAADKPKKKRNPKVLAGIAVGVLALGGGGFYFYSRHAAAQERTDEMQGYLAKARTALAATDPGHWNRAVQSASKANDVEKSGEAYGIAAEASLAGALEEGVNATGRLAKGRGLIGEALEANVAHPAIERAKALQAITTANPTTDALERLSAAAPGDGALLMYLGWGQAAKGDHAAAIKTFDKLAGTPREVIGLYHRGRSKLALSDLEGATADFTAVLAKQRDHIGAMVGLAAALPPAKLAQQEADLLALMNRKDFKDADPRVRVLANVLLGDAAQRAGRLDVARKFYRDALAIAAADVLATTGLAEVELRDNKPEAAKELVEKAVRMAPNDVRAQLAQAELSVRVSNYKDAEQRLTLLSQRQPPLAPLEQARLHLIQGFLHEARLDDNAAVDAYITGAKIAGDLDLGPMTAAVRKLSDLATRALEENDPKKAEAYRQRADALLGELAKKAESDPALALSLGIAYLQAGDPAKAEPLLRQAAEARPNDADPMFQLAKSLAKQDKLEDAISQFKRAMEIDPTRTEIGFELAKTYEAASRDAEASDLYDRLLQAPDLPIELRGRACRFFGKLGQVEKAAAEGEIIYKANPKDPAGAYCKGEGSLLKGNPDEARKLFQNAVQSDSTPQFLDAQGRAAEAIMAKDGDTKLQEEALRVYGFAHTQASKMLNPIIGMGRIYLARKEWSKAIEMLVKAYALRDKDPQIAYMIGVSAEALNDAAKAIQWYSVTNASAPTADSAQREGFLQVQANNAGRAKAMLSLAVKLAVEEQKQTGKAPPWVGDAHYEVGNIEETLGNLAGARESYERYLQTNPPAGPRVTTVKNKLQTSLKR